MNNSRLLWGSLATLLLFLIAGCGGSDQTSQPSTTRTVSGVAATGAPILGTITLKDKNGLQRGPIATDLNGNFSIDVTGLASPFLLKVDWLSGTQPFTLFSLATEPGTANINPFTNLMLRLATNSDPAANFGGSKPDTSQLGKANILAAQVRVQALFAPLLTKYGITSFDPVSGAYAATPDNKLDTMLDLVSVSINNGILSLTNKLDGSMIGTCDISNIPAALTLQVNNAPDPAVMTDIKEITQALAKLKLTMNLGSGLTAAAADSLFIPDPYYGTSSGQTRAQDVGSIVALFGPGGSNSNGKLKSIQNLHLVSDQSAYYANRGVSKVYLLNYDFIFDSGSLAHGNVVALGKETSSGLWKFIGDAAGADAGNNAGLFEQAYIVVLPGITELPFQVGPAIP